MHVLAERVHRSHRKRRAKHKHALCFILGLTVEHAAHSGRKRDEHASKHDIRYAKERIGHRFPVRADEREEIERLNARVRVRRRR
ncbi:hypothetical protein SDC9_114826 [bioreactor metagenome]|uniref:Uncharacterized protein n=1 Tax=bioreactor metagenome TaxID=1076179 RepID=A0A645BTF6_9ZZZZ